MKPILYMMRGLPGAGKTTEARRICAETGAVRVNKDDMRRMMFGEWYRDLENLIHQHLHNLVESLLYRGYSVVVDNTNLRARDERRWFNTAETMGAQFMLVEMDTPLDTCIARDAARGPVESVGEDVIRDFARRFNRE